MDKERDKEKERRKNIEKERTETLRRERKRENRLKTFTYRIQDDKIILNDVWYVTYMYITCYSHLSLAEIAMQSFVLISMFLICFSTPFTQIGLCMSINTYISRSTFIYKSRVYVKSRSNGICGFFLHLVC